MPISWNEIKTRALDFSRNWTGSFREKSDAYSFVIELLEVYGMTKRRVNGYFEYPTKRFGPNAGWIDFFWPGMLLIEMKSTGKDLDGAYAQALEYLSGLKDYELPKYIIVSDFAKIILYELETQSVQTIQIGEFYQQVQTLGFIAGYQTRIYGEQDPVNIKAADLLGQLHDLLAETGYRGHELRVYLVRVLFCLFAEDTGIFDKQQFQEYIEQKTSVDGHDLAHHLATFFYVLNQPIEKRLKKLDEHLAAFRYVNGNLFEETLPPAAFDRKMRATLLACCALDWSRISPAIFGSMFQNVMDADKRHSLGAHYTSENNILKVIGPLFLDDLRAEFGRIKSDKKKLEKFHVRLSTLTFLDPACGCGNFLVITYRELRLLEIEIIKALQKGQLTTNVSHLIRVDINQFYGIEYEEFPARIAEVALWLTDHQMNMKVSVDFGEYFVRLPLAKRSNIVHGNALRVHWGTLISQDKPGYILGNPPFLGKSMQSAEQKADMELICDGMAGAGILDYVAAWYLKAARLITKTSIRVAFVSTNSICQGEQVGALWQDLYMRYGIKIQFAHQTFSWTNEARGNAAVHVIIVGFAAEDLGPKRLFEYDSPKGEPKERIVSGISPYLIEGREIVISKRSKPILQVPQMLYGSKPVDDGALVLSDEDKTRLVSQNPALEAYIKPFLSAYEFLHNEPRWCFWLDESNIMEASKFPELKSRIKQVKDFRLASVKQSTKAAAEIAFQFGEIRQPTTPYILIPLHTSETRRFIPMGFFGPDSIVGNSCSIVPEATLFHFGILTSMMHMAWVARVCGRIKSDFRYSGTLVYNNFPWPAEVTTKQRKAIEKAAQLILDTRDRYLISKETSLAMLYDALFMPADLVKAHKALDKLVDTCYRPTPFLNDTARVEHLFELYERYTADLFSTPPKKRGRGGR